MAQYDGSPVVGGYVLLISDGQIVNSSVSDDEGRYILDNLSNGEYMIEVTCMGFKTIQDSLVLSGSCERNYK